MVYGLHRYANMSKKNPKATKASLQPGATTAPAAAVAQPAPAAAVAGPITLYSVVAPKRPLTGTKFGVKGNEFTHAALATAAQEHNGELTWEQVQATCIAAQHKSFAGYALRRLKILVPVQPKV